MKILVVTFMLLIFPIAGFATDPNLDSYKRAGECLDLTKNKDCVYCPQQKKFISLAQDSRPQSAPAQQQVIEDGSETKEGNR
ncbi:hypothetical protein [Bdellovibrio reynosensis]|uniref:Uncharacterized protein n=1 Tax=Bdellovibrio reynosensis TaxID=2835041 RepID=A0ABY4C8V6_9BACT|nr:hypothetical protein [Bdellovibrio reynosensis]UOF00899.1 hypothetical protein MNR06_14450 [Bdellovibrio reynosensis]